MTSTPHSGGSAITRDFTVAVLVVHAGKVLLHYHAKLERWLPPGGHIEPDELPDEAAIREVWEETGVEVTLRGEPGIDVAHPGQPRQLCRPAGIQLEDIGPDHQHIDLIYFAAGSPSDGREGVGWFGPDEFAPLALTEEVTAWCIAAIEDANARTSANNDHLS